MVLQCLSLSIILKMHLQPVFTYSLSWQWAFISMFEENPINVFMLLLQEGKERKKHVKYSCTHFVCDFEQLSNQNDFSRFLQACPIQLYILYANLSSIFVPLGILSDYNCCSSKAKQMMIAASGIYQKKPAFIKPAHPLHNYLHFFSLRSRKMATAVH